MKYVQDCEEIDGSADPRSKTSKIILLSLTSPHGGLQPSDQKLTYIAQLAVGPQVVQIWSRTTQIMGGTEPA